MKNERTDIWTAVTIGAVVGIGAALIIRAEQEDRAQSALRHLSPVRDGAKRALRRGTKHVRRGVRAAGDAGADLRDVGEELLEELREGARDIVKSTRRELRKAAREAAAEAGRAVRVVRR